MDQRTLKVAKRIARRIREIRLQQEMSQETLADEAGFDRAYMWKLENARLNPTLATLVRLAAALRVDVSELFAA